MMANLFAAGFRNSRLARRFACKVCDAEKFQKKLICPQCSEVIPSEELKKRSAFEIFGL